MPKLIALIRKQPQLSRAEFAAYYEANHAPLVARLLPMVSRYARNYLPDEPAVVGKGEKPAFDVLTELWFENDADLAAFWERIREPDVMAAIREDETHFLISDATVMYQVDEATTAPGPGSAPAG